MPAVNGAYVWRALKNAKAIVMACNTRNPLPIPGIMKAAQELDAVIAFELSKREIYLTNIEGLYPEGDHSLSGMDPSSYADIVSRYAEDYPNVLYFLHGDHIQIKKVNCQQIYEAQDLIELELEAGFTSFGIDPSFVSIPENVAILTMLARPIIECGFGLEAELGEITTAKGYTTVEEAVEYITRLKDAGIDPDLLVINNGSKHGNYDPGEEVRIATDRTKEVYEATGKRIAQHGITGTPMDQIAKFAEVGVLKGNVGTEWQNVLLANVPGLEEKYKKWTEERRKALGLEKLGIEYANAPFLEETLNLPDDIKAKVADDAYTRAKGFLTAFKSQGTASIVRDYLAQCCCDDDCCCEE
ncbi:MAG: class II fructose-bisphosphate aldolase [Candidatus Poribacteria bacterium]